MFHQALRPSTLDFRLGRLLSAFQLVSFSVFETAVVRGGLGDVGPKTEDRGPMTGYESREQKAESGAQSRSKIEDRG